jgi:hypothetical protein
MQIPQREFWTGDPERLPDGFTLTKTKGDRTMTGTCEVWTHQFGWELRLVIEGHSLRRSWVAVNDRDAEDAGNVVRRDAREELELTRRLTWTIGNTGVESSFQSWAYSREASQNALLPTGAFGAHDFATRAAITGAVAGVTAVFIFMLINRRVT